MIAALVLWQRPWSPESVERPSIVVLPFENGSGDRAQDYFADSITEELIGALSKSPDLFVISRNSAFAYRDGSASPRQAAEALGVRYVLAGRLERRGERFAIEATLLDSARGDELWVARRDASLADLLALRAQLAWEVLAALEIEMPEPDTQAGQGPDTQNLQAYDAFLRGWNLYRRFTPGDLADSRAHFETAIALDPDYGRAHAALAAVYFQSWLHGPAWHGKLGLSSDNHISMTLAMALAKRHLDRAMAAPTPLAYRLASAMLRDHRQFEASLAAARRALQLDPNDPAGHMALARAFIAVGQAEAAIPAVERAMRLDPLYPASTLTALGLAELMAGRYEQAAARFERAYERNANIKGIQASLAVSYAYAGRMEAARRALEVYTSAWPNYTPKVDRVMQWRPFEREADLRHYADGLIMAGLCCEQQLEDYVAQLRRGGTLK